MSFRTNALKVQAFAGAVYGIQVGTTTMAQINADITSAGGLSNALNGYYTSSFGSVANATVATTVATNLGLTGDALTSGAAYITAELNAAAPAARGAVISNILDLFAGLASDATFGAAATAYNTKVDAAVAYTGTANVAIGSTVNTGTVFTLTTSADLLTGTAANDTFSAPDAAAGGAAWTLGDELNGGAGTDTLKIVTANAITAAPTGAKLTSVENIDILSSAAVTLNVSTFTDVASVTTTAAATSLTASATQTVSATASDAAITVNGGNNVTVVSKANVTDNLSVGATTAAAGNVSVSSTGGTANGNTNGTIGVTGGKTISVTQNAGNKATTGVDTVGGAVTVTGDANTTSVSVTQTANNTGLTATTTAAGAVGFTAGLVKVADKNAASNTAASTITEVTLSSWYGTNADAPNTSSVDSGALSTLNLSGNGNNLNVTAGALTTAVVNTLALNVNGLTTKAVGVAGTGLVTVDTDYKTINLNGSTAASTIADLSIAGATALNVSGDAAVTLTASTVTALKTVTVTNTAGFKMDDINATTTFTGGAGADAVTLANAMETAVNMGDGNDKVTYGGATSTTAGKVGSVTGGAGTDTISMTSTQAAAADGTAAFNTSFTSFEVLEINNALANGDTIDLEGLNSVTSVVLAAGGAHATGSIIDRLASGGNVETQAASTGFVVQVAGANLRATDTLNLKLTNSTNGTVAFGSITAAGVETINITTNDTGKTADTVATVDTATLVATAAKSIVVTGNNGLNLTNTGNTAVTSFDASGVAGNAAEDTAALLAVTFASANTTTTANVSITGGAGNDVLTGNAAKDSITGGAGGDIVNGGMGQDVINVGNGHDVIRIISDINVATGPNAAKGVQSTTSAADVINGFVLASAITTAADLSDAAKFIASTAGGANTSMLSIDLNKDDAGGDNAGTNVAVAIEADVTTATAAQAVGTTYTVSKGILSLGGSGASAVDTLAEWLVEAAAVAATDGETIGFVYGGDTYVFAQNGTGDTLVQLVGVAATSLVLASATTTATAGAVIIGDSL